MSRKLHPSSAIPTPRARAERLTPHRSLDEYDEARELTNGVYEDYKYRQAVMQQLNEFKRTRNGFVSKLLEIYGGKKDK